MGYKRRMGSGAGEQTIKTLMQKNKAVVEETVISMGSSPHLAEKNR